jgi:predicted transcriptional regulator
MNGFQNMSQLGFSKIESSLSQAELVPWREAFPELSKAQENGIVLKETRKMMGLTQKQLSKLTEIPQRHISEMETAKRPIGKESAKKFAKALDVNYRVFL